MFSNRFCKYIFVVIVWCSTGSTVRSRKASIVTPIGDSSNNQQWSLPFYDNNFGMPPPAVITPQPIPVISSTSPTTVNIGRTNSVNILPAVVSGNETVNVTLPNVNPLPSVPINTALTTNYTAAQNNTAISESMAVSDSIAVSPIVLLIDPNYMIQYTSTSSNGIRFNSVPPTSTPFPSIAIDPSYIVTYSTPTVTTNNSFNTSTNTTSSISTTMSTTELKTTVSTPSKTTATLSSISRSTIGKTSPPLLLSSLPVSSSTLAPNPNTGITSSYRPLGPDCDYKPVDLSNQKIVNSFQIEVPTVIKFDVNITSIPNNVVSVYPVSDSDSDVVEIVSSSNKLVTYLGSTSSSLNSVNIDVSDPDLDLGWSSSGLPKFPTSPPQAKRISQDKCIEYFSAGRRTARTSRVQVFIINGQASKEKEFPHMAALGYGAKASNQWLCGGSLISENFVVTAGHCLSAESLGPVQFVRLGTTTLQTETLESADYNVIRRIPYPTYVEGRQYDDIALLQLDRPVEFTEYIAPICLYTSPVSNNAKVTAIGWGKTTPTGSTSKELQKVDLDVVSYETCQKAYSLVPKEELPYGILRTSHICAGVADGSKDTCQGDSGGPLSLVEDGRTYLVGITSFGIGCAQAGVPGVYTKVSHYVSWLEQTVWGK